MINETALEAAWQTFTHALRAHESSVIGIAGREALRVVLERWPATVACAEDAEAAERLREVLGWKKLERTTPAPDIDVPSITLDDLGLT